MSPGSTPWFAGFVVAALVGAGLYWLLETSMLALSGGLVWGCAAGITAHLAGRFPDHTTGSGWPDSRWTALGVGIATFATLLGVYATESLPVDLRFGLAVVVLGVGSVGYLTGSMAEFERTVE